MFMKNVFCVGAAVLVLTGVSACKKGDADPTGGTSPVATQQGAPTAPTALTEGTTTQTSVAFSWTDNASNETSYELETCLGLGCSAFASVTGSPFAANTSSATLTGLAADTIYEVRVRATNSAGSSAWLTGHFSTLPAAPAAPTNLGLNLAEATSLSLTWDDQATDETGYQIQQCSGGGCTNFADAAGSPFAANATSATLTGLLPETTYEVRIRAIKGAAASAWVSGQFATSVEPPAAPTALVVGTVTWNSITFSWTDNATNETGYEVEFCEGISCSNFAGTVAQASNTTSKTLGDRWPETVYRVRVRAFNMAGASAWLTSGDITTPLNPPVEPGSFSASSILSGSVGLSWWDSATNETAYDVQYCSGQGCTNFSDIPGSPFAANSNSASIGGLTGSTKFSFRVRARNSAGSSNWVTLSNYSTLDVRLIDNMENNGALRLSGTAYPGAWWAAGDGSATLNPNPFAMTASDNGSYRSVRMNGGPFTGSGAAMGIDLVKSGATLYPFDANAYTGISFWAKVGSGAGVLTTLKVGFDDINSSPSGGVCSSCGDTYMKSITLTTSWRKYTVLFTELVQGGSGVPANPFDKTKLYTLKFAQGAGTIDLWVDDIYFIGSTIATSDSFDGRTSLGATDVAAGGTSLIWQPPVGTVDVNGGNIGLTRGGGSYSGLAFVWGGLNCSVQAKLAEPGFAAESTGIVFRRASSGLTWSHYALVAEGLGNYRLDRFSYNGSVLSSTSTYANPVIAPVVGDILRAEPYGPAIILKINGVDVTSKFGNPTDPLRLGQGVGLTGDAGRLDDFLVENCYY